MSDQYPDIDFSPPQDVQDAAAQGLEYRREYGRGGTEVGIARARDLSNGRDMTPDTIGRMVSFFARHEENRDPQENEPDGGPPNGWISWLLWGGDPGKRWAEHLQERMDAADQKDNSDPPAEPDERIKGSKKNPDDSASGSRGGIEITEDIEKALKRKRDEHNEKHGDEEGKKVDLGMLKAVYRRGAGAFSTSHREGMSRNQWAMARVNSFLYLVRNGKPENSKYTTDNDLLPDKHPRNSQKDNARPRILAYDCAEGDLLEGVQLFGWGEVQHPKGTFDVNEEFAREMLASFEAMTSRGYYPPVLEEHKGSGTAVGLVRRLYTRDDGIYADFELADGVLEEVDEGRRPYISPSFFEEFTHPNTGKTLRFALREVSFVSVPHLKNLRPLGRHYALSESGYLYLQEEQMDEEQIMDRLSDLMEEVAELRNALKGATDNMQKMMGDYKDMMGKHESGEDKDMADDEPEDMGESKALREQVDGLAASLREAHDKLAAAEVRAATAHLDLSDKRTAALNTLYRTDREQFDEMVAALSESAPKAEPFEQAEHGTPSKPSGQSSSSKLVHLCEQLGKAAVPFGSGEYFTALAEQGIDAMQDGPYDHAQAKRAYERGARQRSA